MNRYKAAATFADSKKCSALVTLARKLMPQGMREDLALVTARQEGARATVLDADLAFALEGCDDAVGFLNRALNLSHPGNRHVVKEALQDALDDVYVAETPVQVAPKTRKAPRKPLAVKAVEATMAKVAKVGKAFASSAALAEEASRASVPGYAFSTMTPVRHPGTRRSNGEGSDLNS